MPRDPITGAPIGGGGSLGPSSSSSTPVVSPVKELNEFEQAAAVQSEAALQGADIQSAALQDAIAQLLGFEGFNNLGNFSGFNQFTNAGNTALTGLQEGATASGLGNQINQIMQGDAFRGLVDERQRALQGQLAASGLNRSGAALEAAAAIPTDLAFSIQDRIAGNQQNLAGLGLQGVTGQANLASQSAIGQGNLQQAIANLLGQQGFAEAEGIRSAAEAEATGILGELGLLLQQQQQEQQNQNDLFGLLGTGVGSIFGGSAGGAIGGAIGSVLSDPRLKTNVRVEGQIGPLDLVRWDWIPEVEHIGVNTFGFMADQVQEHYPEHVFEIGGFNAIDYPRLIETLNG